ncbi:beta/gamma crystallin domain-containing protein 2 [Macrotis lagotis]|uniref:beta/gamma crystallin domain-containing protein 2 n=1 Tax=Macrotis lagotis TaxID=92651 RepID=UPI003D69B2E3
MIPGEGGGELESVPSLPWELKPAQPAPCPGSPEEFRGCRARVQAPPQKPRPITGCPDFWPWEPQLKQDQYPRRAGKPAGSRAIESPGSLGSSVLGVLSREETESPQGKVPGPGMEEAGTHPAQPESGVVSATLTWRHRPPAQEEVRHRFHKVSLVSQGGGAAPQEESYAYTYHREEVNGITTCEEETVNSQGPKAGVRERHDLPKDSPPGDTKKFLSHEPIFSKMYTPLPKEKKQQGKLKEAAVQLHSSNPITHAETSKLSVTTVTRAEGPVTGPREASPHPGLGSSSGTFRASEERRVTRTVRTTTIMGGRVEKRTSSSSSLMIGPTGAEGLPRGRHVARTVRAVVVGPRHEGSPSPSRSQALEILTTLVPSEPHPPKVEALRRSRLPQAISRFQGPPSSQVGVPETQGQPPKFGEANQEEGSGPRANDINAEACSPKEREVPIIQLSDSRHGPSPLQLPLQVPPTRTSVPSSSGPQHLSTLVVPELPTVNHDPTIKISLKSKIAPTSSQVKSEDVLSPSAPQDSSFKRTEVIMSSGVSLEPSPKKDKIVSLPRSSLTPSPQRNEIDLDSEEHFVPSSTKTKVVPDNEIPFVPSPIRTEVVPGPRTPLILSPVKTKVVPDSRAPLVPSPTRTELVPSPRTPLILSPVKTKVVPGPGTSLIPTPTKNENIPDSGTPLVLSPTKNMVVPNSKTPLAPSPTRTEVVSSRETPPSPTPTKKEVVPDSGTSLITSPTKEEIVPDSGIPLITSLTKNEVVPGSGTSLVPSPTRTEVVPDSGTPHVPSPTKTEVVPDSGTPHVPSPTKPEVVPDSGAPHVPSPTKTEAILGTKDSPSLSPLEVGPSQSPANGEVNQESVGEDEEVALTTDLELFLDTLRNMEPPEILHTHRLPRAPRSSYLAMYATLPAIEEDQASTWTPGPRPEPEPEPGPQPQPESDEEPENPYLSDDEKLQRRQEKANPGQGFFWDIRPSRQPSETRSPLDMMKLHVADVQGPQTAELGPRRGAAGAPPSRLEGSLLFGGGEMAPSATLGAKLSSLRPHASPALEKGPGRIPLLSSQGKPQIEAEAGGTKQLPEVRIWEEKEQGKLNTRPGKIILFSEPGCQGEAREVWGDVTDATGWLPPPTSLRVLRGGWLLYEKPGFQGQKLVLPEGDMELRELGTAWSPLIIGSLRRIVRDYVIPEISLFSKEGNEGVQVKLTEALEDAQGQGQPLLASSITVTAGLWLLYSKPNFTGVPCILEPGVYPTPESWGSSDPQINSLKPLTLGCPSVEKPGEPKALVYEAKDFQGHCWEVSRDIYDLRKPEDGQSPSLATVGSLRILGGCWVGYEKEGFRGHQYLLEEGEYPDWSHWGGYDDLLTSLRVIRTDFSDPAVMLFEAADFEGPSVGLSEALSDVQLAGHSLTTQAIHVLSGVWVAYELVGFSGEQYVLEKGVYRNCDDWGAGNSTITSLQPILQVGEHDLHFVSKIQLFSGPDFLGDHISFEDDQASLPPSFQPQSCRVYGGSWILFEKQEFEGEQHVLSEGEFPTLTAMGCLTSTVLSSLRKVPLHFSEPSVFLYGLECFEGKEIELNGEVRSLQAEGFNSHVLSIRIKGGVWVLCEHSDFRGRHWLVGSTEITNWLTYSGTQRIGSLYPIKQRRVYFCLRNKGLGRWLAVPEDVEDMKAGRVVVSETRAGASCIWYYEDGLLKNQVAPTMSLQVIGQPSPGSKVVLWTESRQPRQTWSIDTSGHICSEMFEDKILDVKGGRGYDRDHAVLWDRTEDRPSQIWDVQVL